MNEQEFGELIQKVRDTRKDVAEIKEMVKDQNGRVRDLEINKADQKDVDKLKAYAYKTMGALGLLGAGIGAWKIFF